MHPERHEAAAPEASQYVPPPASIPDDYWRQVAEAKVAANTTGTSTVACWVCVLLGLIIPIFALCAGLWAVWMAREDSRFMAPAAVGFGIFALPFLA
ncbi:MAG: hypothetical protein M3340_03915 [Actinomycetota bacterium]|nr:hypothetical protein [Actinomycetota bacterium]